MTPTPKEKAEELFNKINDCIPANNNKDINKFISVDVRCSKQCVLIAVDEILCTLSDLCCQSSGSEIIEPEIDYWQEVKNEIELL